MRLPTASILLATVLLLPAALGASDHRDAPIIDEDVTVDLGDLLVFPSPEHPDRLVLALTVNPFTVPGVSAFFSPSSLYEFKIDNTGDAIEDLVLQATFTGTGRSQQVELRGPAKPRKPGTNPRPLGGEPAVYGPTGEVLEMAALRLFAGLRDDPFFFDQQAFFVSQKLRRPGIDFYAGKNVSALVVELPRDKILGKTSAIRVWAAASRLVDGGYWQQDRVGLPAVNVVLVPGDSRDAFNLTAPAEDAKRYGKGIAQTLAALGITDAGKQAALAGALLPDTLVFDAAKPAGFLNGRRPEDDVIDAVLGLLATNGGAVPTDPAERPSDNVDRNDRPFLKSFPYLAEPHAAP